MDRQNALTSAELKRRGIAAIEQALPAMQWLLTLPPSSSPRIKAEIDAELAAERDW